jgi:hypothetical protein
MAQSAEEQNDRSEWETMMVKGVEKENERSEWIRLHGSARLKKGLEAGLQMNGVYRTERIKFDLGDKWYDWSDVPENDFQVRTNAKEHEIDTFVIAKKMWPDSSTLELRAVRCYEKTDWEPALMMTLPWEPDAWAIMFIDRLYSSGKNVEIEK